MLFRVLFSKIADTIESRWDNQRIKRDRMISTGTLTQLLAGVPDEDLLLQMILFVL